MHAVDDVSFSLRKGETLGVVGESGCGKSTLARVLLRLIEPTSGEIYIDGVDLSKLTPRNLRAKRREFQMVFQDAYASLDSRQKIGNIIAEPLIVHGIGDRKTRRRRVAKLLDMVGLEADAATRYPHEFSGGQRQRIGIARAISLEPKLVVADEPVSALDVSIQAQIINLLEELQEKFNLTYLFIAHDLAVVRHISHRVMVMYLGRAAEMADADTLYRQPLHPYTRALMAAVPVPDPGRRQVEAEIVKGDVPSPLAPPSGCSFRTRCPLAAERCADIRPELRQMGVTDVACHYAEAPVSAGTARQGR